MGLNCTVYNLPQNKVSWSDTQRMRVSHPAQSEIRWDNMQWWEREGKEQIKLGWGGREGTDGDGGGVEGCCWLFLIFQEWSCRQISIPDHRVLLSLCGCYWNQGGSQITHSPLIFFLFLSSSTVLPRLLSLSAVFLLFFTNIFALVRVRV